MSPWFAPFWFSFFLILLYLWTIPFIASLCWITPCSILAYFRVSSPRDYTYPRHQRDLPFYFLHVWCFLAHPHYFAVLHSQQSELPYTHNLPRFVVRVSLGPVGLSGNSDSPHGRLRFTPRLRFQSYQNGWSAGGNDLAQFSFRRPSGFLITICRTMT